MEIMGIQGNLLQLFASADKKVEDFLLSLKQGDILKGKVLEIFANDNRALINFKGYNVVSQLPQTNLIQKGDIINVVVSQMGDKVLMKLINESTAGISTTPQDLNGESGITGKQLLSFLESIQVPVNEQNVFIAQRMIDYQVPITKENLNSINMALARYVTNNSVYETQNPLSKKQEILLALISAAKQSGSITNSEEANNVSSNKQNEVSTNNNGNNMPNIFNKINSDEISLSAASGNLILNLKNIDDNFIKNLIFQAVTDNIITQSEGENLVNTLTATGSANLSDIQFTTGTSGLQHTFNTALTENTIPIPAVNKNINEAEFVTNKTAIEENTNIIQANLDNTIINKQPPNITEINTANNKLIIENDITLLQRNPSAFTTNRPTANIADMQIVRDKASLQFIFSNNSKITNNSVIMTSNEKELVSQIQSDFDNIENNMHLFNNTNIKEMLPILNRLNEEINTLSNKLSVLTNSTNYTEDINKVSTMINKNIIDIQNGSASSESGKIKQFITDFINFTRNTTLFKTLSNTNISLQSIKDGAQQYAQSSVDIESAIESLVFLKSRNIPIENDKFIDTMAKYFRDDMKLNQGLEKINDLINKFNNLGKTPNDEFTNNINKINDAIKNLINEASIKLQDDNLKQENVTQQIRNFIDKSGLNIENKLKEALLNISGNEEKPGDIRNTFSPDTKENLKSMLIKLLDELNNTNDQKQLSVPQKDTLNQIKDASTNILNNMNAIQLINQKPAAFDMIYTQIPIFSGSRLFNGEIQVWYRKGSIKENFKNSSAPVNIVFLLNTSGLGNVKISLNILKNDVQCSIKTESEKAKQVLSGGKNNFIDNLKDINFNVKGFNINIDKDDKAEIKPLSNDNYIQSGMINFKA